MSHLPHQCDAIARGNTAAPGIPKSRSQALLRNLPKRKTEEPKSVNERATHA